MTATNKKAVEAARAKFDAHEFIKYDKDRILGATTRKNVHEALLDALTAALPFLAPQPSADADEIACNLLDICPSQWPLSPRRARYRDMIAPALAAVRAEATLAGAVAERDGTWEQLARLAGEQIKSANSALAAKDAQIAALRRSIGNIRAVTSRGQDGTRTHDQCAADLSWIEDESRAALEMSGGVL